MPSVPQPDGKVTVNPPERPLTLMGLAGFMIRGFIRSIPKQVLWTVLRAVLSFAAVFILHTWLVVFRNDGFRPEPSLPFYRLIAFDETRSQSLVFWSIAAFLLSSFAGRIFYGGFRRLFADFVSTPDWVISNLRKAGKYSLPSYLTGILLSVAISFLIKSNYVITIGALALFLSITSGAQGMWFLVLSTGWSDIKRLFLRNKNVNHSPVAVFIFGLTLGMILAASFSQLLWGKIAIIGLSVAGLIIVIVKKRVSPSALVWLGAFIAFQAVILKVSGVFADDGGWKEAGATFKSWWDSEGRSQAVAMSFPPGFSAFLGAFFGGGALPKPPPIPEVMDYNAESLKWHNENGKWVLYQTDNAGNKYGKGIPQSLFNADPKSLDENVKIFTQPTCDYSNAIEKIENLMDNLGEGYTDHFTPDGWKALTTVQKEKSLAALADILADAAGVKAKHFSVNLEQRSDTYNCGSWNEKTGKITINTNSVIFDNPFKIIKVLAHEVRHVAQDPDNLIFGNADLGGGEEYKNLIRWNYDNYTNSTSDYTRYSAQLVERDADAFGRKIGTAVFHKVYKNKYKIK
ncbi:MAG: hypothetical protein PHG48_03040 [Eubacteriales bacterium]|nr:hypothetical protein [Eubacteriales bacterium]